MKKQKNLTLTILKIVGNTIFYLVILLLLLFSISNISAKKEDDIPNIFGKGFVNVLTSSMDGDNKEYKVNSFKKDSLVFVKVLKDEDKMDLKIGDVVVFWGQLDPTEPQSKGLIIHRIIDIDYDLKRVQTQGDNKVTNGSIIEESSFNGIKAVATSKYEGFGRPMRFIQSSLGFALVVLLPITGFIIFELVVLIRYIIRNNKMRLQEEYDLERERIKEELLKEMQEQEEEK